MFTHYLKAALRNLRRSKLDSLINILGLSFGLAAAILILLFVRDESSYDNFWPDISRVFRLETRFTLAGRPDLNTVLAMGPAKTAFERYFSGDVETVARMNRRAPVIKRGADIFTDYVMLADPEILDIFPLQAVAGDPSAALSDLRSIVITESFARKYFGDTDPMGQTMTLSQYGVTDDYTVAAVVRDLPANSHIDLNAMIAIDEASFKGTSWLFDSWYAVNNHVYVKLRPGVDINDLRARLDDFTNTEVPADEGQSNNFVTFRLRPVRDIHLHATGIGEMKPRGDANIVLAFTAIAFLIVAVAAINFVNLATARAGLRAREVALRKVVGARRGELIRQHLAESVVVTGLATALALGIVQLLLPEVNSLLGKSLASPFAAPADLSLIAFAWLTVAILSGLYPAYLVSGFRPGPQLHGTEAKASGHAGWGRNLMVAFQSAVTISLIAATGVVAAQLNLFRSIDKGFNQDQLIALTGTFRQGVSGSRAALKTEVEALPMVTSTTYVSETPGSPNEMNTSVRRPDEDKQLTIGQIQVDHDFIETFGIRLLAGRGFDRAYAMDRDPIVPGAVAGGRYPANILINRLAARTLGFAKPEDAIGQHIVATVNVTPKGDIEGDLTIVGVTDDIYFHTVKHEQRPEIYRIGPFLSGLMVRYTGNSKAAMAALEGVWKRVAPTVPFDAEFVDQVMAAELDDERVQMELFSAFAALTIIIAALGLYGLAAFSAERRTKEIGIRRVLGARVADVFRLMLWQFSKPVIIAIVIASPVAAYLMLGWLEKFPYRIPVPEVAGYVALAGVAALLIAWATVSSLTFRVARANPVHALKHE